MQYYNDYFTRKLLPITIVGNLKLFNNKQLNDDSLKWLTFGLTPQRRLFLIFQIHTFYILFDFHERMNESTHFHWNASLQRYLVIDCDWAHMRWVSLFLHANIAFIIK
jgi:hypothetical protein